jgi:hypothetical protein
MSAKAKIAIPLAPEVLVRPMGGRLDESLLDNIVAAVVAVISA